MGVNAAFTDALGAPEVVTADSLWSLRDVPRLYKCLIQSVLAFSACIGRTQCLLSFMQAVGYNGETSRT